MSVSLATAQLTFFAPPVERPVEVDAEFEEAFWPAWRARLQRANNPKDRALEAFRKARKIASLSEIMDGMARFKATPVRKYRPMAATWLNDKGWRDESGPDLSLDPWGIDEWLATEPDDGMFGPTSYDRDELDAVMISTGWPETWRGDLGPLGGWLRDGFRPDSIQSVIVEFTERYGSRSKLDAFDRMMRAKALRFDASTFRYRSAVE